MQPFICRHCRAQLATTDGARLHLSEHAYTDEPTPLRCGRCGARRFWRPVRQAEPGERAAVRQAEPVAA